MTEAEVQQGVDLHPLISKRWSPRAYDETTLTKKDLLPLFEAARWAASSMNEQPWRYIYALRGTEAFEKLWNGLLPGNQAWADKAAALIVSVMRTTNSRTGAVNGIALHDVGMANAQLVLQATAQDLSARMMGGIDRLKIKEVIEIDDNEDIVCLIALGKVGSPELLDEPYRSRETAPRERKPIESMIKDLNDDA